MARLIFTNEDEQNNNEQPSSIVINDNKSSNIIITTKSDNSLSKTSVPKKNGINSLKNRSQLTSCHIPNNASYKANKILVSNSTVARLTSKFNAVSTDENRTTIKIYSDLSPAKKYSKKKSFTSSSVIETIKFFENDTKNKTSDLISGKQSTDKKDTDVSIIEKKKTVKLSENISSETELENCECSDDNIHSVDKRSEPISKNIFERITKPVVQPKPAIFIPEVIAGKENRSSQLQKTNEDQISEKMSADIIKKNSVNSHYHAPKLFVQKDKNANSDSQIVILKNKRLSIAKDFSLESVLNDGMQNEMHTKKTEMEISTESKISSISPDKTANDSFLYKYLEQCSDSKTNVTKNIINKSVGQHEISNDSKLRSASKKNLETSSSLHNSLIKTFCESQNSELNNIYEYLPCLTEMIPEKGTSDHLYSDIRELNNENDGFSNVYDDVIYAQLYNNDDVENYETVSSDLYSKTPNILKYDSSITSTTVIKRSDSDSSFEQANSLYGLKPTSDFSSAASTFSSSNDCINIKTESSYVSVTDSKTTNSDVSDHDQVCSDNWDSDENIREEIIVFNHQSQSRGLSGLKKRKLTFLLPKDYVETPIENDENIIEDDFDSSSSDSDSSEINGHIEAVNQLNKRHSPNTTYSHNIYGLVERATRKVRKSWNSFSQIRKISVGNVSNNFPLKNQEISSDSGKSASVEEINLKNENSLTSGGSMRWTSFKRNLQQNHSTSVFYLKPEDLCFGTSDSVNKSRNSTNGKQRRMTCTELRATRPTSPPPPPPVDKLKLTESHNNTSNSNTYSDRSNSSCESRSSIIGGDAAFDLGSSRSSDLHLRFADEPLYQFYAESIIKLNTTASMDCLTDSDGYEEIASNTSRPSAMELITPSPNGHGQYRSLWCEVEEVKNSGILETLSPSKLRIQEAIFEIITSEASYYKSLSVLDKIFAINPLLKEETVLTKINWKILFGNVAAVRSCSERLLAALEKCWQECILLTGLCDIIYQHASENFKIYVKYCSNQIYIDRTLKNLKEQNGRFVEIINQLEANPMCQSLSLHSFLMLPMQRITRMPLLIDAVLSKMDPLTDSTEYKTYQITLATLNKIVKECNETARKLERYEEMLLLSHQLEFSRKDVKMFPVASTSRWLIRSGPMVHINLHDIKSTFTRKLTKQTTKFYFFLFNDIFVVSKKKNDDTFVVFDYCARNMLQMNKLEENYTDLYKYLLHLTILENHEGKTIEMILNCDSDSTRQRWLEATSSHLTSDNPEEKLYEEWDCPQVSAVHAYTAVQPDELSLQAGDVVKVLKKTTDGWYHGERIRDGMTGWFPGNYTLEIASQHMRAKNLRLRYRLLILSGSYLQYQQQKKL